MSTESDTWPDLTCDDLNTLQSRRLKAQYSVPHPGMDTSITLIGRSGSIRVKNSLLACHFLRLEERYHQSCRVLPGQARSAALAKKLNALKLLHEWLNFCVESGERLH